VGRGTGLDDAGLERKLSVLKSAAARRPMPTDAVELLTEYGGFEIAMLVGVMLAAAARRMVILVDGFTVSVAAALALRIDPAVKDYLVFAHCSAERGHRALLDLLGVEPLLNLRMRLGEGTGSAVALSVVRCAVALFNDMATFASAGVSEKN
jgi:nicotinate-nucleotide--dimethylbenzimidazole phosphoribosyltransferase